MVHPRFLQSFKTFVNLLMQGVPFEFNETCMNPFELLKKKLTSAPIVVTLDWNLPFELMCDASDFAVGVILG